MGWGYLSDRLDEGVAYLEQQLHKHAPIDVLLGFSQGANMCTILCGRAVYGVGLWLALRIQSSQRFINCSNDDEFENYLPML